VAAGSAVCILDGALLDFRSSSATEHGFVPTDQGLLQTLGSPVQWRAWLGELVAWGWAAAAGGGGAVLLVEHGPFKLTNGWFALMSGVAACPLTAYLLSRRARFSVSGRSRLAAAVVFFVAGKAALALGF